MRGLFELGRYHIDHVSGSPNLYRFWYDRGAGEIRRRSLKTPTLEAAKIALAAIVLSEGTGKPEQPDTVVFVSVFQRYLTQHAHKTRGFAQAKLARNWLLDYFGDDATVGTFRKARQREFLRHLRAKGHSINYIAKMMTLVNAALNYVTDEDDEGKDALLIRAPKLIYTAKEIARELREPEPAPQNWHPDLNMIALFLNTLTPEEEVVRRFVVLKLAFACRSEAALEAGPFGLDTRYKLLRLNPAGRRQTKKHRATLPVPENLWPVLSEDWIGATFVGPVKKTTLYDMWGRARSRAELPADFIPHSIRHFMATAFRHAHINYGVERVPEDEREMWLGHRRQSVHNAYGAFEPDYLRTAKRAVEAILESLNARLNQPIFRQMTAKAVCAKSAQTHLKALSGKGKGI